MAKNELPEEVLTNEYVTCYHCGESCREEQISYHHHNFCCEGCRTVYDLLKENDLCQYYRFTDGTGNSPDADFYQGKFDHLDLAEVRTKLLEFTDGRQERVNWLVPKMHCSSCIWLLEQLHRLHPGVWSSVVNFPGKNRSHFLRSRPHKTQRTGRTHGATGVRAVH